MLPNFLLIGVPKAGTTALYAYLKQHPDVFMSPHKEPRYFALCDGPVDFRGPGDRDRFKFVTDFDEYQRLFDGAGNAKVVGEASQWYFYVPSAAPAIRREIPDAKLVVVFRDPVDRAFSNFQHARNEGLEPCGRFRDAMDAEADRIEKRWSPRFHYVQKGFYFRQLEWYYRHFPKDQIKLCFYEDLTSTPDTFFAELFDFLDIDSGFRVDTSVRHNDSSPVRSPWVSRMVENNLLRDTLKRFIPRSLGSRISGQIKELNVGEKLKLSPEDRARYIEVYREDILRFQDLVGRDLSAWTQ